jgi:membrane protease YdiL (CAAX protease family)
MLALVPGIWEELAFRGLMQSKLRTVFSGTAAILLSSLFFSLFHFSNLVTQAPSQVIPGVILAFFFGIGWGYVTLKANSVVPAMISHYLVDSMGQIFLGVDSADPALTSMFFVVLMVLFPVFNLILAKLMVKSEALQLESMPV